MMMRWIMSIGSAGLLAILPSRGPVQQYPLDEVLSHLEAAGEELQSLEAALDQTRTIQFTGSRTTQSGRIFFSVTGDQSRIRITITQPGQRDVLVEGGQARSYVPDVNQLTVFDLGERADAAEYFMLGFGPANARLREDYRVALVGEETLEGVRTSLLELEPRSERIAGMYPRIRLWIDQSRWVPVRSQLNEPSGDHTIIEYSEIRTNLSIPDSTFELKLPKDVQTIYM